uniref:Uncharacterized protein n=1 Tax=Ditylenchus dipsaci TaxID=166011 RepID=A0A915DMJ8_9BILA
MDQWIKDNLKSAVFDVSGGVFVDTPIEVVPTAEYFDPESSHYTINMQKDSVNCGFHVAVIAEAYLLNRRQTFLENFYISAERERLLQILFGFSTDNYNYVLRGNITKSQNSIALQNEDEIRTAEQIDKYVYAEIPDPNTSPRLYKTVTTQMIHGPCGHHNPNCGETAIGEDSYAFYKRSENGHTFENKNGVIIDNRWVVPYNKKLALRYDAHINVEICASIKSVKYLYKYCYKGHDCARIVVQKEGDREIEHDEIKKYVDMRYVTPHEAFWRMFELDMDEKSHSVTRLDFHLPDEQAIYYKREENIKNKIVNAELKDSMLTDKKQKSSPHRRAG